MPCHADVNLFIIGVQKGGTTALHRMLTAHPEIASGRRKELHFFDDEQRDWQAGTLSDIESHFDAVAGRARYRLDATPIYCFWPQSLARLHAYNPRARLCLMLRHPAYRAVSHWRMMRQRKVETLSFAEAIGREDRRDRGETADLPSRSFSYVARGFYAPQIRNLLALFDRDAVFIERTDRLWLDPVGTLHRMMGWLDLSPEPLADGPHVYDPPVDARQSGRVARAEIDRLSALYAADIRATAKLSGVELTDWLSPDYRESMPSRIG